ncbi:MAG: TolC family protein, partial [Acidobacteriaceae bacterium]|nr:TolC family protein [Acidobacteriaceae bacterium]
MKRSTQFKARNVLVGCSAILSLVLTSCAVGPNYQRPKVDAPTAYRGVNGAAQQASMADLAWWEVFKDDTLKGLIKTALTNNYDMAAAVARVEQEQQMVAEARSQFFPQINYNTVLTGGKNQFQFAPSSNTNGVQGFLAALAQASWEIDLWGRIRRSTEAARAQLLATEEAKRGVMLT